MAEENDWIEKIVVLYFGDYDDKCNEIRANVKNAMEWYSRQRPDLPEPEIMIPVPVEVRHVAITPEQVERLGLTGYQLEALTTKKRVKAFKTMLMDSIDECWSEEIFEENCPPEEYDYEAHGEEKPKDIDVDNTEYLDETGYPKIHRRYPEVNMSIRDYMIHIATQAFKEGWEDEYYEDDDETEAADNDNNNGNDNDNDNGSK
jgi:hypothetical protein